jgi:hypothetical protein
MAETAVDGVACMKPRREELDALASTRHPIMAFDLGARRSDHVYDRESQC